jgi:hypothetical protein
MATTYQIIASVTVGAGGTANITFTSIPATYTDLVILYSTRAESSGTSWINITLGSGGTYSKRYLYGNGAGSVNSGTGVFAINQEQGYTANTYSNGEMYIPNYLSSATKFVMADSVSERDSAGGEVVFGSNSWSGTSAVSTIVLTTDGATDWEQYSTAYLYGISNA